MNKEDLVKLYKAIEAEKGKGSVKFRYALLKNEEAIKGEINALAEIEKSIDKIIEPFLQEQNKLIKELGTFDEAKKAYVINQDEKEKLQQYSEKLQGMEKKYDKEIHEHNDKLDEYREVLKEELQEMTEVIEISLENCPEDLSTDSLEIFMKCGILK